MDIAVILDTVKPRLFSHKLSVMEGLAHIVLFDGSEWQLSVVPSDKFTREHIALWNLTRSIAFENEWELNGWLRCYRSMSS